MKMKKLFTRILTLLAFTGINVAVAGNLAVHTAEQTVTGPDTVILASTATVVNNGATGVYVRVSRSSTSLLAGHSTYFCWVACYSPVTSVSPDSIYLAAGDSTSVFVSDVTPHGIEGNSTVTYTFFDSNPSDDATITFTYSFYSAVGINEVISRPIISNAYPNPAVDGYSGVTYNLNSAKDAKLVLYNLLGTVVREIKLVDKQSTIILSTADLQSGVYYYSLIADGKAVSSKKLVVSHR